MGAPQDPMLEDWVLMDDPLRRSAGQSRKGGVHDSVQEDWERAEGQVP